MIVALWLLVLLVAVAADFTSGLLRDSLELVLAMVMASLIAVTAMTGQWGVCTAAVLTTLLLLVFWWWERR